MKTVLVRAGMNPARADAVVAGSRPAGLLVSDVQHQIRDDLLQAARGTQVDALSGDSWVFLQGTLAHLAPLTRPGRSQLDEDVAHQLARPLRGLSEPITEWKTGAGPVDLTRPVIAGIVNVTPDSFSDGGRFLAPDDARRRAGELVADGADILDVGAYSTRPGAEEVSLDDEWRRLEPALVAVRKEAGEVPLSIDTFRSEIARRSIDAGAAIINDVSGLRFDDRLGPLCARAGVGIILMHSRGDVSTMASYNHVEYDDIVFDVATELTEAVSRAADAGVAREAVVLDPGLGFGKRGPQNHELLVRLSDFAALGFPVMVGPSRKRFVRDLVGSARPDALDEATASLCVLAALCGARLFRVHRAGLVRRALDVVWACRGI